MVALVTGAAGFVGRHLVAELLACGRTVRILYRRDGVPESLGGLQVEVARGDVRDLAGVERALDGVVEVFHLAGLTRSLTPRAMREVNVGGTANLLAAAKRHRLPGPFVFCSSAAARGPTLLEDPGREPVDAPLSWYGRSKLEAERLLARHADEVRVAIVRPPAVYGPGDRDFLSLFVGVARGLALLPAPPDTAYSLVYVQDLARALVAAARRGCVQAQPYFVSHPERPTLAQVVAAAEGALGRHARRLLLPRGFVALLGRATDALATAGNTASLLGSQRLAEVATGPWTGDPSPFMGATGWRPRIGIEEGFALTVAAYRAEGRLPSAKRAIQPGAR